MLCRLRRWSIFDSDAMPMFFISTMRCRRSWPFLTIAIGAIIFGQQSGPIFSDGFSNYGPMFSDHFFCKNLKTAYFTTCSNWRQFVRIGGHHLRKYRIYKNASGGNSGILWDGLIIHRSIKHTWMLALRQSSEGVYLEQLYSPTL